MGLLSSILSPISAISSAIGDVIGFNPISSVMDAVGLSPSAQKHAQANEDQRNLLDRQEGFTMQMAQQTHDWNVEDWERQQAYNTPEAQRERLLSAGYNPLLAETGSSIASSPVTSQLPSTPSAPSSNLSALASMMSAQSNSALLDAQRENIQQDTKLKASETNKNEKLTDKIARMYDDEHKMSGVMVSYYGQKKTESEHYCKVLDKQTSEIASRTDLLKQQYFTEQNITKYYEQLSLKTEKEKALLIKQIDWYDKDMQQKINESISRQKLNGDMAKVCKENALYIAAQTTGQIIENGSRAIQFQIFDETHEAIANITLAEGEDAKLKLETPSTVKKLQHNMKIVHGVINLLYDMHPAALVGRALGGSADSATKVTKILK